MTEAEIRKAVSADSARTAFAISEIENEIAGLESDIGELNRQLEQARARADRLRVQQAGLREAARILNVYAQQAQGGKNGVANQSVSDQDS